MHQPKRRRLIGKGKHRPPTPPRNEEVARCLAIEQESSSDTLELVERLSDSCTSCGDEQGPIPAQPLSVGSVKNIRDACSWFTDAVKRHGGEEFVERIHANVESLMFSTAFSGIGAAEVALDTIRMGLEHFMDAQVCTHTLFAIEKLVESQDRMCYGGCVFYTECQDSLLTVVASLLFELLFVRNMSVKNESLQMALAWSTVSESHARAP